MAARVNVKFAVALAAGILLVGGAGLGVAYFALQDTGDEFVERGDAALAAGDLDLAAENYERAVGQDRTRLDWLEKWRAALIQISPPTQAEYEKSFSRHYLGILEQMAVLEFSNPRRQRDLLEARYQQTMTLFPSVTGAWQQIADLTTQRVERLDQASPEARALLRYRGLATLSQMAMSDVEESVRQRGLSDLRAAFEADPTDFESKRGVVIWHAILWRRAYLDRRTIEARRLKDALDTEVASMLEAFPGHHGAALTALETQIEEIAVIETEEAAERAALRALLGAEAPVIKAFRDADPRDLTPLELARLNSVMGRVGTPDRLETLLELTDAAIGAQDVEPRLITLKVEALSGLQRYTDAIEGLQTFLALPNRPVSLQGLVQRYYRPTALQRLAEVALAQWEAVDDANAKAAAIDIARGALNDLSENTVGGEQSVEALTVRGKLAQAEGRNQEAVRIFTELVEKRGQTDSDTRWRLSQALRQVDQLGASKSQIQLMLDSEPTNLRALLSLADIHARLKEDAQARAVLATVRELYPDLAQLDRIEARLDLMLDVDPELEATRAVIAQARELRSTNNDADMDVAYQLLKNAYDNNPENIPITIELVNSETLRGQTAEARRLVAQALAYHPNDPTLERLRRALNFDDPFAAAISLIDESEMTGPRKAIRKYLLAQRYGKDEVRSELLAQMKSQFARDTEVLEILFSEAVREEQFEEARRLVGVAAETNADQANGLIFQGRLELIQGRTEAAVRTLRQAADILPYSSRLLLILGDAELRLGQVTEALRTLEKAYSSKPDDANVASRYATTLVNLQRFEEALAVTRSAIRFSPLDLSLRNQWLDLEDRVGDRRVALTERESLHEQYPTNEQNSLALAALYLKFDRFSDAAALIDQIETNGTTLNTALMRARMQAAQGDIAAGQQIVTEYLSTVADGSENAAAFVSLADFLFDFNRPEQALEVLLSARNRQSDENREVDRRLGDYYFNAGEYEESLEYYRSVLSLGTAEERVALRTAETLVKLERFDEAERVIAELGPAADSNVTATLIRAYSAAAQNKNREARALFDRAVELKPNDPSPFLQRAQYSLRTPDLFNDALADVDQAIRLQPELVSARRMKAEMLASRGRSSEAIAELRRAVDADPENDDLRSLLVQYFVRVSDFPSAISFADRTVSDRPGELYWVRVSGDLNARAAELSNDPVRTREYWTAAAARYRQLQDENPSDESALRLANARLLQSQPDPAAAFALVETMSAERQATGNIRMLRARALHALGRVDEARSAASASLATVTENAHVRVWFDQLRQMLGSTLAAGRFAEELTPPAGDEAIFKLMLVVHLSADPDRQSELLGVLDEIDGEFTAPEDRVDIYRQRGRLLFQLGRHADSATAFEAGVAIAPNDLEFNNNIAYIRSTFLNDPQGAVAPAERAAQLAPQNANVLDTLGWVYFNAGQATQAQQALQSARQYATTPSEYIPIEIHLGNVFISRGDKVQASRLYQSARERLQDAPGLQSLYGEALESLRQKLEAAE